MHFLSGDQRRNPLTVLNVALASLLAQLWHNSFYEIETVGIRFLIKHTCALQSGSASTWPSQPEDEARCQDNSPIASKSRIESRVESRLGRSDHDYRTQDCEERVRKRTTRT